MSAGRTSIRSASTPLDPRRSILGASSDHLVVDVTAARGTVRLGDRVGFAFGYGPLLAAMTSPYVATRFTGGNGSSPAG
jgi:ornithine racemase